MLREFITLIGFLIILSGILVSLNLVLKSSHSMCVDAEVIIEQANEIK